MIYVGVLFSLGSSMLFWSAFMRASGWIIAAIGAVALSFTAFAMPGADQVNTLYAPVIRLLLVPCHTNAWQVFYPIIPWLGVTAMRILMGRLLARDAILAMRTAGRVALALGCLFVAIRLGGGLGNLNVVPPGFLGFFTVVKYPPSLAYLCITLAINLLVMSQWNRLESIAAAPGNPLLVFGQCAMMFYLVHLWVYAVLGLIFRNGSSLVGMYGMWLVGLVIMYPFCKWYKAFKRTTPTDSFWRFF